MRNGVHGISVADLAPSRAVFIAIVPVLLYSFVGVELPATAAEEMTNPRRDIPVAIGRAGIGQALMYGMPILAVLIVLPAGQITSLHGLIDAIQAVLTSYGGSVAADGTAVLTGWGQLLGWVCAIVFIWVLVASGSAWIMGAGRAQAAACLDGAGPRVLGRISPRSGVPVIMGLVSGAISLLAMAADLAVAGRDNQKYFSAALVVSIALIVLAYLLIFPAFVALRLREPNLDRTFRVPGGVRMRLAGRGPGHGMVPAGRRLPAVARARHRPSGRCPARGLRVAAWAVRASRSHPDRSGDRRDDGLLPRYSPQEPGTPGPGAPSGPTTTRLDFRARRRVVAARYR